jgi:hypothetical protein
MLSVTTKYERAIADATVRHAFERLGLKELSSGRLSLKQREMLYWESIILIDELMSDCELDERLSNRAEYNVRRWVRELSDAR